MSARNALIVATGIGLSRLMGLVRERALAHTLGVGPEADVFRAALRIPNLMQNLLGEGTLSASFIPVYSQLRAAGRHHEADRLASTMLAVLVVVSGALVCLGAALAPALVALLAPGFLSDERYALAVPLVRLTFPMTGLLVLSAWALGVLNSHRRFFVPYLAPVAWNLAIISAFVWTADDSPGAVLWAGGLGALVGGAAQLCVQLPSVFKLWKPSRPLLDDNVKEVLRNAIPAVWGRGAVQISGYVDHTLATLLSAGSVATMSYAQTLTLLPSSLFGMSIAAAELPELSTTATTDPAAFSDRIRAAGERVLLLVVPSAVALAVLGDVWVTALLRSGAFDDHAVGQVTWVLIAASPGIISGTTSRITVAAFNAMRDTSTPARIAVVRVVVSALLGIGAMAMFEPVAAFGASSAPLAHLKIPGVAALAAAASVASIGEAFVLRRKLAKVVPDSGVPGNVLGRQLLVSILSAIVARWVWAWADQGPLLGAVVALLSFVTVWVGMIHWTGSDADRSVVRRLTSRFRR